MYLNTEYIHSQGYTLPEIFCLQLIRQNKTEDLEDIIAMYIMDEMLDKFNDNGLVTSIKKKNKSQSDFAVMRLSKKAEQLLEDVQTYGVDDVTITIFEWLKSLYLKLDKKVGSEKKCKELISWFRKESQIDRNDLVRLCSAFVKDEKYIKYSQVLQYVFYKGDSVFQVKPRLEDSKLWAFYEENREEFDKLFEGDGG